MSHYFLVPPRYRGSAPSMKASTEPTTSIVARGLATFVAVVACLALAAEAWRPGLAAGINPAALVVLALLAAWLAGRAPASEPGAASRPWLRRACSLALGFAAAYVATQWVAGPVVWQVLAGSAAAIAVLGAMW